MRTIFSHRALQDLYETGRRVLDNGDSPELLRASLEYLEVMAGFRDSCEGQAVLERAREQYACKSGEREVAIDDATVLDYNEDNGYWVMTWCFVEDDELAEENDSEIAPDADAPHPTIVR